MDLPGRRSQRNQWTIATASVVLVLLLLLSPLPRSGRATQSLMDLLHLPLFATIAAVFVWLFRVTRTRGKLLLWVVVVAGGVCLELLQRFAGRGASWQDAFANACGAAVGIASGCVLAASSWRKKVAGGLVAVVLLAAGAWQPLRVLADLVTQRYDMPLLASFESDTELQRWVTRECTVRRTREHATAGEFALKMEVNGGHYPGIALSPPPDWSRYRELVCDVFWQGTQGSRLIVKVYDAEHNQDPTDRFGRIWDLQPGRQEFRIALSDIAAAPANRRLDLKSIAVLQFYMSRPQSPGAIYLDHLRLE